MVPNKWHVLGKCPGQCLAHGAQSTTCSLYVCNGLPAGGMKPHFILDWQEGRVPEGWNMMNLGNLSKGRSGILTNHMQNKSSAYSITPDMAPRAGNKTMRGEYSQADLSGNTMAHAYQQGRALLPRDRKILLYGKVFPPWSIQPGCVPKHANSTIWLAKKPRSVVQEFGKCGILHLFFWILSKPY